MGKLKDISNTIKNLQNQLPQSLSSRNERNLLTIFADGIQDDMSTPELLAKIFLFQKITFYKNYVASFFGPNRSMQLTQLEMIDNLIRELALENLVKPQDDVVFQLPEELMKQIDDIRFELLDIYDKRSYQTVITYQQTTLDQSNIFDKYNESSKSSTYYDGDLVIDFIRGGIQLVDEEKNTSLSVNDLKEDDKADATRKELLLFTRGDKAKADILNRFCHQMLEAVVMEEYNNNFKLDTGKACSAISPQSWQHTLIRDKSGELYTDIKLVFNNIMSSEGKILVKNENTLDPVGWDKMIELKNPNQKIVPPLIEISARAQLIPTPSTQKNETKENPYCMKMIHYQVILHLPDIVPKDNIATTATITNEKIKESQEVTPDIKSTPQP